MQSGQATMRDDDCLLIKRKDGFLEETYFSWSVIPLVGEDGSGPYPLSKWLCSLILRTPFASPHAKGHV
jgi:hypothetical protein